MLGVRRALRTGERHYLVLTTKYSLLSTYYKRAALLTTHYKLVARCSSPLRPYSLLTTQVLTTHYSLLTAHYTHYALLTTHYSLLTTHYSLLTKAVLTTHYALLTPHYALLTTHYALLTRRAARVAVQDQLQPRPAAPRTLARDAPPLLRAPSPPPADLRVAGPLPTPPVALAGPPRASHLADCLARRFAPAPCMASRMAPCLAHCMTQGLVSPGTCPPSRRRSLSPLRIPPRRTAPT